MQNKEFYKKVEEYVKKCKKEEIQDFIGNMIRKIPESKFEEVLCMINSDNINISENEIKNKIKEYKDFFNKIEEGELCFYAEQYEDYSNGWDDWCIDYTDKDNIGDIIKDSVEYAVKLVNYKKYKYAKEIFDMVLKANYKADDEIMGETLEISLLDIQENNLICVNIPILCLYTIYVTYQTSDNKVRDIYNYFKYNPIFRNISIEDCFKLGVEKLTGLNEFYPEWINYLSKTQGDMEYRLLKEALIYTDFMGYEKYIDNITKNQPKIYIDIFKYLQKENKKNELIDIGNRVLETIDSKVKVGSDVALYLANIDEKNKEKYLCEAFKFNSNVLNLLRIINNGYYKKNENDIKSKIGYDNSKNEVYDENEELNCINKDTYNLLQFFVGDFEEFYNESIKHNDLLGWSYSFEKISVYLWLLLLNENKEKTKSYSKLLTSVFSEIGYCEKEKTLLDEDIETIWRKWKSNFKINDNIKEKVLNWLDKRIEDRVKAIMEGNYRKSYYKAALLVVAYDEMCYSQDLSGKYEYIRYYINKYSRRSAFKSEINILI